jgi:hypothetical protein
LLIFCTYFVARRGSGEGKAEMNGSAKSASPPAEKQSREKATHKKYGGTNCNYYCLLACLSACPSQECTIPTLPMEGVEYPYLAYEYFTQGIYKFVNCENEASE